jgi:hypothetical protein
MPRFYGAVGYITSVKDENSPDVWVEKPVEQFYKGELLKNFRNLAKSNEGELNDDVTLSNQISITANPYALSHMADMRYVKWMGTAWKVTGVDASNYPRLILSIGGVYNGETAG